MPYAMAVNQRDPAPSDAPTCFMLWYTNGPHPGQLKSTLYQHTNTSIHTALFNRAQLAPASTYKKERLGSLKLARGLDEDSMHCAEHARTTPGKCAGRKPSRPQILCILCIPHLGVHAAVNEQRAPCRTEAYVHAYNAGNRARQPTDCIQPASSQVRHACRARHRRPPAAKGLLADKGTHANAGLPAADRADVFTCPAGRSAPFIH